MDILDTMVATNAEASVAANGIRDNVIACAGTDNKKKDESEALDTKTPGAAAQNTKGRSENRSKRSVNEFTACCKELSVQISDKIVDNLKDNLKDTHNEWVGPYFLESQMSNANQLVYKRSSRKRYLFIRRQSNNHSSCLKPIFSTKGVLRLPTMITIPFQPSIPSHKACLII